METSTPDALILDIQLPDGSGLDLAQIVRGRYPNLPILILSGFCHEAYMNGALKLGIQGYVLKDEALEVIALAVKTAVKGEIWLSP